MPELIENIELDGLEDEEIDDYSDDSLFNITSWGADLSFRELISMYEDGELLKPELQRNYVWDRIEASRFLESVLMGLPVPSIFLAKVGKKKLIVDGYQRIMTIYDYIQKGIFSKDGKVFKISNSKRINKIWRGKAFSELTEDDKISIKSYTIHAIIFEQKKPKNDTSLYQIFERINTSGRSLTPQEIRNCVYQGSFNKLLISINSYEKWRNLFGSEQPDSRMQDMELILRFFALNRDAVRKSTLTQISLKKTLNEFMGEVYNSSQEKLNNYKTQFCKAIDFIYEKFGINAFNNISESGTYIKRFHVTIYDSIMIATSIALNKMTDEELNAKSYKSAHKKLLSDDNFIEYISLRTTNIESINGRIEKALQYLYGIEDSL